MKNLLDYRLVILTNDNHIKTYNIELGVGHAECLERFADSYGYYFYRLDYLVSKGHSIFYNVGNNMSVAYLPVELDEDRLYTLDYLCNWLDKVDYMEVLKGDDQCFILDDDVMNKFSNEVIQSYYEVKSKGRK